jgi:alanine racemase
MKRTTIKDIAERAGVSKTAVSFAFNDPEKISKDTRDRIMAIADELGYIPDPLARSLSTNRAGTIGFLLPQPIAEAFNNPYIFQLIQGIGEVCHQEDLSLTLLPPVRGSISEAVRNALIDGIIAVGVGPDTKVIELLHQRRKPFVTIDGEPSAETINIGIDDEGGAYEAMRHALDAGHRRIAILSLENPVLLDPDERYSRVSEMRIAGYRRALAERGLDIDGKEVSLSFVLTSIEAGIDAMDALSTGGATPTAAVCMSDIIACGVYEWARIKGLRIPDDISVLGFDDIPMAAFLSPGLSTVRQPGVEKGHKAARIVVDLLAGKASTPKVLLPVELVSRGSVAAPKPSSPR